MSRENPRWIGSGWCPHEPACTDKAACCDRGEAEEQERIRHPLVTWKAGAAVAAGQLVAIGADGLVRPFGLELRDQHVPDYERECISPKAAEPRRVQVGDVWQVRGDVAGYDRAPRRVLRLGGFPHNPFAQCERGADMLLRVDGTADPELWTLVLAARPKAAVGQRWRCAAWAGGVQTVVFALSTGEETPSEAKMGAPYHGWVTLVDGTMPEPWEYVGEAEPLLRPKVGETLTIDKPLDLSGGQRSTVGDLRLVLAQTGFATAPIFVSHGRVCVYTDAIDEQAVRVTLSDVVPAWVVIDVETWPAAAKRLACSAAAFAFLAEERMAVHLRRVAVDNAIAACPEDLDPVGWRAAVLAYADVQQKVKANRLDPDTCDLEVVLLDYVPGDELDTADVAAQEAYRRATAPSARVRRRGEEIR